MSITRAIETVMVFGSLLVSLLVLFVPITVAMVLLQRWLGDDRLARLLGSDQLLWALLKGTLLGAVTPFCGCSTIPLLLGLLRARVRFGGVAAFLFASPLLNPYILGVVGLLFGGRMMVVYALAAAATSMGAGAVWELTRMDRHLKPGVRPAPVRAAAEVLVGVGDGPGCGVGVNAGHRPRGAVESEVCDQGGDPRPASERTWTGWRTEVAGAGAAASEQLRPMLRPMLLGVSIGALLYGAAPEGWLADLLGATTWWSLPAAAVLGLPLYLRGEAAFPIGAGLLASGVGEGPMFAMVIAGMGASLPEVTILSGIFRPRLLGAFLATVFTVAIIGGLLIPPFG